MRYEHSSIAAHDSQQSIELVVQKFHDDRERRGDFYGEDVATERRNSRGFHRFVIVGHVRAAARFNGSNFIQMSPSGIDLAQPWLQARRYITPITAVCNNVGTYELPPPPPHLIRARSSYAGLYKAGCLRRRRSAIIIIMPLSLHCGGKRWGGSAPARTTPRG